MPLASPSKDVASILVSLLWMFKDPTNWFLPCSKPRNCGDKVGWLMTSSQEQIQHYSYYAVKKQSLCSLGKNYRIIKYFCCAKLVLNKVPFLHHFVLEVRLSQIILCCERQYFFSVTFSLFLSDLSLPVKLTSELYFSKISSGYPLFLQHILKICSFL